MQAYIKYKGYYDKKTNASKLKKWYYVYGLQPEPNHQGSKINFTDFRWIGPYIVDKASLNNKYLVRKVGRTKPKSFIAWDGDSSRLDNPNPTYKHHHKKKNLTLKSS